MGLALCRPAHLLLPLLLRARPGAMSLVVADRASLWLPYFRRHAEHGGKLGVDLLAFCDEVFDARDVRIDVQENHLLSSAVKRLKVPPIRCQGSIARWGSVAAFSAFLFPRGGPDPDAPPYIRQRNPLLSATQLPSVASRASEAKILPSKKIYTTDQPAYRPRSCPRKPTFRLSAKCHILL
jgi:hypothetical protein